MPVRMPGRAHRSAVSAAVLASVFSVRRRCGCGRKGAGPGRDDHQLRNHPPIAEYTLQSIAEAATSGAAGLIIRLDTPGGLDLAMRDIAKGILNAPLPVIVYVAPSGARAASAGLIITIAAHVAAMSPGTNIGAATPSVWGSAEWTRR